MAARFPKPFWRASKGCWYVQIHGKQLRLDPNREEAFRRYHDLMSRPAAPPQPTRSLPFVSEVLDAFLESVQASKAPLTYTFYRAQIQILAAAIPPTLAVDQIKPYHVTRVMDAHPRWSNNSKHNFVRAVQRAFRWAKKQGLIDQNPVADVEKPAMEARDLAITPADSEQVLAAIDEHRFRDLVRFAWESGVRPQEIRIIEARHIDFERKRIVFPPKESKGKKSVRVIYLTDEAVAILRPLAAAHPTGTVFRTSKSTPWTKDSINCAFCRLQKKLGKKFHLGAFRKGYCTEALKNGVDTVTVAHLMGHANAVMVSRVYAKVSQDPEFMAEAARRAKGKKPEA